MLNTIKEILTDAWAFVIDQDARKVLAFKYPSGAGMSVRVAKQQGLM